LTLASNEDALATFLFPTPLGGLMERRQSARIPLVKRLAGTLQNASITRRGRPEYNRAILNYRKVP
jgi:hypothetical protein